MRLGQLIENARLHYHRTSIRNPDLFYIEDCKFVRMLETYERDFRDFDLFAEKKEKPCSGG